MMKPKECAECVLYDSGRSFIKPEGTGVSGVLIVGEVSGEADAREGKPMRPSGAVGHVLDLAIKSISMTREQFVLWNAIACKPPGFTPTILGQWYEYPALDHCKQHLRAVVEKYRPRVIVALGPVVTRLLTGLAGKKLRLDDLQGFELEAPEFPGIRVIPTYDPGIIQRGSWQLFPVLRLALGKAVKLARDGWRGPEFICNENASAQDVHAMAEELEKNPELDLNFDFETDGGEIELDAVVGEEGEEEEFEEGEGKKRGAISTRQKITQVNLSIYENEALAVEFNEETRYAVERILGTPNFKHGHNCWLFDLPVAEYNGIVVNGIVSDSMWLFHHIFPDLPGSYKKVAGDTLKDQGSLASLQFCASFYGFPWPWKHMRLEQGGLYGCYDGIAGRKVHNGAVADAKKMGVYESYKTFVLRLRPILRDAERRGLPINTEKLKAFIEMLRQRQEAELETILPMIPKEVCAPKQAKGLKKLPKNTEGLVQRSFFLDAPERCECTSVTREKKCKECAGLGSIAGRAGTWDVCDVCKGAGKILPVITSDPLCCLCGGKGEIMGEVVRWCHLKPFNPNSPHQMKAYATYEGMTPQGFKRRHVIPKNSKRKYAMDKETLERMEKSYKDPVYGRVLTIKSVGKFKGTYGEGWLERVSLTDEHVHTQFLYLPATGQLSSTNPNVQNVPHPTKGSPLQREYATAFRTLIEAKSGKVLIELDYKSYHACTLAWEAKDWQYLRLAKMDAHSYLTGFVKKIDGYKSAITWDDEKLMTWLNKIKKEHGKERNEKFKPALLGWGFGLGGRRLYNTNPEAFRDEQEALGVFKALDYAFPVAAQYRRDTPEKAYRQKYLKSAFDCIRWFWNVKEWNPKKKEWDHGTDWDKSIAFRPANDAFCAKKLALLRCEEKGYLERYGFINDIHDAFMFHCDERLAEECIHNITEEMERPSEVMLMPDGSGFSVEVETKMGKNWADMKEVKR